MGLDTKPLEEGTDGTTSPNGDQPTAVQEPVAAPEPAVGQETQQQPTAPPLPPPAPRTLIFMLPYGESISDTHVLSVLERCEDRQLSNEPLELVIDSTGGDAYSAYKIVQILRSKTTAITVVVPFRAKSAATLMALAADKIVMGPQSELGPLDLPVEHPTTGIALSALDAVRAVEYFASVLQRQAKTLARSMRRPPDGLARRDAYELALDATVKYLTPIVEQLDPQIVHMSFRELQIAERYGDELLQEFMLKGSVLKGEEAGRIANELVWEYPAHGFNISRKEAERLGLVIVRAEDYPRWDTIWKLYRRYRSVGDRLIMLLDDNGLKKLAGVA